MADKHPQSLPWAARHADDKGYQTTRPHSLEDALGDPPPTWFSSGSAAAAGAAAAGAAAAGAAEGGAAPGSAAPGSAAAGSATPVGFCAASTESGGPASRCADRLGRRRGASFVEAVWSCGPASETLAVLAATGAAAPSA